MGSGRFSVDWGIVGSKRQLELADLKLQAQVGKYKSGLSTLADVVRFQRDLDNATSTVQRVIRSLHVGRARVLAAIGTLGDEAVSKLAHSLEPQSVSPLEPSATTWQPRVLRRTSRRRVGTTDAIEKVASWGKK